MYITIFNESICTALLLLTRQPSIEVLLFAIDIILYFTVTESNVISQLNSPSMAIS